MFKTILAPLDLTTLAENALPWAFAIARRAEARLELVEVHRFYSQDGPKEGRTLPDAVQRAWAQAHEQLYLTASARWMTAAFPIPVSTAVLAEAAAPAEGVVESLLRRARASRADLVVMASHRRGLRGSVAWELLRRSGVPVLVVPVARRRPELILQPAVERVLIPLDGSAQAERVLGPATDLARLLRAQCELLHVVTEQPAGGRVVDAAGEYLDAVARRLRADGHVVRARVVVGRCAAEAIITTADGRPHDIVALATQGRHGVVRRVARCVDSPALYFRPVEAS